MMIIFADAGVPMLFPQALLMCLVFIPVVFLETLLVRVRMRLTFWGAFQDMAIANCLSTLFGVPLAWLVMLLLEIGTTGGSALGLDSPVRMLAAVTLQAAWLIPYEKHLVWMIPAAATVLLIPSFVFSVIIEQRVLARFWRDRDRKEVLVMVWRANVGSYLFLFLAGSLWVTAKVFAFSP